MISLFVMKKYLKSTFFSTYFMHYENDNLNTKNCTYFAIFFPQSEPIFSPFLEKESFSVKEKVKICSCMQQ